MADRYWVGGAGTWNTTLTTNWSATSGGGGGASVPTAADSVFFNQAGTYTVTMTGALLCLDITVSAGVVTFATGTTPTLAVTGSMSLVAGTVWTSTGAITFNATTTGKTITTNGTTINGAITFNGVGGGWSLGSALVTGATLTTTLTNGALTLNGFDWSTGIFSSNVASARSVAFGANFINLITTTVGSVVVSMANSTLFSSSGTGGFKADASITRTYTIGTTGGSATTTANLFIPSGAAVSTLTTASWFKSLVFTGSSTTPPAATLNIAGNLTLATGGTYTGLTINMVGTGTIVSVAKTIAALNINSTSGTTTLGDALTLVTNATTTITSGTLALNDFNLNTGIFTSTGTATRSILFGVGNILLTHTTALTTVLNFANATGFTFTGAGGFSADASITRTFTFGTTGGTTTNAPNLSLTGTGTAIATITTASWFNTLSFGTTVFAMAATTLNLNGLTLSSGGTFTSLGMNAVGTGTITPNGKTIAAFTVNNGAGTVTLAAAFGCTTYTQTAGTINFATFNLTSSGAATYTAGTLSNIGTISCTTWTHAALATFVLSSGTISASTSFTVTSGSFTYSGGTITTPSFVHTAGTVTTTATWTLAATCTYTFTAGTITLGGNLSTGAFSSTNANIRSIAWSTYTITLNHSTAATTVLNMAIVTSYTFTGTQSFISDAAVTRTYVFGTTGGTTTNSPNLSLTGSGTAIATFTTASWFNTLSFGTTAFAVPATVLNLNSLTLSATGTYTSLGMNAVGTGTITPNGKTIAALTVNTAGTVTLAAALGCTTYTQTAGTINFATFNLTGSGAATYTAGTLSNIGTISCTTWTHAASATFTLSSGTISASTSFTVTSGSFTYSGGTITTPSFVHTAGSVTTTVSWTLPATCVYTFTAGTITLGANLTTASFISNNTNVRSIAWNIYSMTLNHSTAAQFILNVPDLTNYTFTGTQTFISDASVTRTFVWGTTGGTTTNSPNLSFTGTGSAVLTFGSGSWFDTLSFGTTTSTIASTTVNLNALTLSSGGTFTALGVNAVGTGTITPNGKTIAALTVNTAGTVTLAAAFGCTSYVQTAGTINFATFNLTSSGAATYTAGTLSNIGTISCTTWTHSAGSTFTLSSGTISASTSFTVTSGSFTYSGGTITTPSFVHTAGSVTITATCTLPVTSTYTFTIGTLNISSGVTLSTGIFSSSNSNVRTIAFGSASAGNINLTHTTAATTVLSMADLNSFTPTGPGGFTVAAMSATKTLTCGSAAGAVFQAPNLTFTTGASIATITSGGWFGTIDFGTTSFAVPATTLNVKGFTLSATGTYTGLSINAIGTGTITPNGKTIAALTVNTAGTVTLAAALGVTTWTQTLGTIDFATFNLTCSSTATYTAGTLSNIGTISCTTFTINGPTFNFTSGTINASVSFVLTSGSFTYGGTATLGATPLFTHSAGTVTLNQSYALTTTGTYTLSAGTLTLANGVTLTTGIFSSSNSSTRTIAFGSASAGNINLTHTTAATTVLSMADTNSLTTTGPGGFTVNDMSVARTFTFGSAAGFAASARNLTFTTGAGVATITSGSWFGTIDFGTTSFTLPATTLNIKGLTLSSGGTYTALILILFASGTLTYNGKTTSTITAGAFAITIIDCNCTTFTVNGSTISVIGPGTFSASTSLILNSGSINFGSSVTLGSIPIFTHTSGSVTFNNTGSLGATSTYTFTTGTITLADGVTLSVGAFSSSNSNVRSIAFGSTSAGNINLIHSTAGTTALDISNSNNFTWTGLGGFTSNMSVARSYNGANTISTTTTGSISAISAGQYVTAPANAGFVFGTGDFTIEAYIRLVAPGDGAVVDLRTGSTSPGPYFGVGGNRLNILINGTFTTASTKLFRTNWYHVALCRTGTTTRIFLNGIKDLEFTDTTNYNVSGAIPAIGHNSSGGAGDGTLFAYFSNVRIVKGVGAYVGNFTVPTSPLTTSQSASTNVNSILASQTTLLLNTVPGASTYLVDNSLNNFTITNVGTSSSTSSPFEASLPIGGKLVDLSINGGSSSPTFGLNSYFNNLDFTGSSSLIPANTVSVQGNLTLSATGTYTDFSANVFGTDKVIETNNKPLSTLYINTTSTASLDATTANTITFSSGSLTLSGPLTSKNVYTTGTITRTITGSDIVVNGNTINSLAASWEANGVGGSIFNSNPTTANLVSIPSAPFADLNDFTLEVWAYGTSNTTAQHHFSWGDTGTSSSGSLRSVINMQNGHWQLWYGSSIRLETGSVETPYVPLINRWNHYAVTRTSTPTNRVTLWFNGKNVGSYLAGSDTFNNASNMLMLGSDRSSPSCWVGYLTNFRYTSNNAVYYGNFTPPNTVLTVTQSPSTNIRGIYGAQTVVLMTMSSPLTYLADSSALPKRTENVGGVTFVPFAPPLIQINPNLTVSSTISLTSNNSKIFSGGGGSYGTLNQGGGGTLTIRGNNTFYDITTSANKGMNVTFQSGTTQTVSNFNISGVGLNNGGPAGAYPLGSVTFNGTSQYLTLPAAPATLTFGTGEFTFECWCRLNSLTDGTIYDARTAATSVAPYFYMSSGQPSFMVNNVAVLGGGGANPTRTLTTDTWYHLAISKSGSSTRMFVDGVQVGTTYTDTNTYLCGTPAIAHNSSGAGGTGFLSATFSNIRITKGVGVYTGNFTVPMNPLDTTQSSGTNIVAVTGTQTSLLLNTPNSASFLTDTSSGALTVTNVGVVVTSSFQPFKVYINSTIPGIAATLSKSSGIVNVDDLYIQVSIATGGASWYAGAYSVNVSNNSGWVFSGAPSGVTYSGNFFAFF